MAIKIENTNVTSISLDNEDVKQVVLDSTTVWCKPYTFTLTKQTNVSSVSLSRSSTTEPTASTGTLLSAGGSATIYFKDSILASATAATGYHFGSDNATTTTSYTNNSVDGNVSWGPTVNINTYAVYITAGLGVSSVYLSATSTATSGSASGTKFNHGSTVYAFAVLGEHYDVPDGWVLISGTRHETGSKYRVGSKTNLTTSHNFGTIDANIETYTLTITKGVGIDKIYYKVNGASSYTSSTTTVSVSVDDLSTYYYYATADSYHNVNADCGSSTSPKSGTVDCGNVNVSVSTTGKSYTLSGTYTNGSVTWYSNSGMTTVITSANYGSTVYYKYQANTGYTGSGSGSLVLNTTNFTISGTTASHSFGAATVQEFTLTISITNSSYGTCSVSRTSSPLKGAATGELSNGATIYYGDVLTGTASGAGTSYGSWNITSVTAPTATSTGDATSGNITVTNKDSHTATLYYNTTSAVGGTSLGSVASNASTTKTGLSFNTQYYVSARVSRSRDKYVDATDGTQYSGTDGVTGNVTAAFKFKRTTTTDTGNIDSSVVGIKTAAQNTYSLTLASTNGHWENASGTTVTSTTAAAYGTAVSVSSNTLTVGSTTYTFVKNSDTTKYHYDFSSISGAPASITGTTTVTGTATSSIRSYNITVTKNTGIDKIYYKVNGASSFTEWTTGTVSAQYDSTVYWYATAATGYTGNDIGTSSSPKSFTMGTSGTIAPTATINSYTITFVRQRKDATGLQTLGSAVSDTSIGVGSVSVNYGGSYSETFSKTNYVSQTKSGTNVTADATVTVTLEPVKYNLTKSLTNWTGDWYTSNAYSTTLSWIYYGGGTAYFRATPNIHYEQTVSSVRYYNGQYYTTTASNAAGSVTLSATAITYTVSGGSATNGTVSWTNNTYGNNSTWTITANYGYDAPSTSTGTKAINTTNFSISDANSTATYSGSLGTCTAQSFTVTVNKEYYAITGAQTKATSTTSDGTASVTVTYNTNYTYTYSKTGYTSQTFSGKWTSESNKPAATQNLTLSPVQYTISQTAISNASESLNYSWVYYGYSANQTVTPDVGYDYTVSGTRYYNGSSYTRSSGSVSANYTFGALTMNKFNYTVSGGSSANGTVAWTGGTQIGGSATWTITANEGYTRPTNYTGSVTINSTNFTLSEANKTATYKSNFDPCTINSYAVTITATNCKATYLSTSSTATSGDPSGTSYNYGTTVYGFATLNDDSAEYTYTAPSGWVQVGDSSSRTYRVGQKVVAISGNSISVSADATKVKYTITWRYRTGYNTWTTDTTTYEYGATPLVDSPVSGTVPTPLTQTSGNYRYTFKEWPDVVEVTQNKQYQASYYYQYNVTSLTQTYTNAYTDNTYSTSFDTGWYNNNTVIYWKTKTNYYYGSTSSSTTSESTVVAGTNTNNPTYLKWSAGTYNYCTPSPASGSIVAVGSNITWTASSGYSFAEGTSQTSTSTSTVALGTLSYAKTPGYRYVSISNTNCTATISTGYRAYPQTITWTPSTGTNYKYSFTNTADYDPTDAQRKTTESFTATGTNSFTKNPSEIYYNTQFYYEYDSWLAEFNGIEIVSDPGSGQYVNEWHYLLGGESVEFSNKANDNNIHYAFSEDDPQDLIYYITINSAGMQINDNMDYYAFYHCIFSGTNTNASSMTNWYQYGDVVTITANSSSTYKYSFSNSNPASPTTTKTHNVTTYGSFTYNASYTYYKVTINASSTGPTNYQKLFASLEAQATSGTTVSTGTQWILKNYYLRAQAIADPDSYDKYNFSNSSDSATKWTTSSQITSSTTWNIPTMYKWIYFTSYSNPNYGHADVVGWNSLRNKWLLCSSWSSIDGWSYSLSLSGSYYYGYQAVFDSYTGSTTKTEYVTSGGAITLTSVAKFKAEISVSTYSHSNTNYQAWPKCGNQSYFSQIRTQVQYATNAAQTSWSSYSKFTNSSGTGSGAYIYWPNYTGAIVPNWQETTLKYIRLRTTLLGSASTSDFWPQPSGTYDYYTLDPSTSQEFN